jgi:hypothetical protein
VVLFQRTFGLQWGGYHRAAVPRQYVIVTISTSATLRPRPSLVLHQNRPETVQYTKGLFRAVTDNRKEALRVKPYASLKTQLDRFGYRVRL